jgi:hypothetical protein
MTLSPDIADWYFGASYRIVAAGYGESLDDGNRCSCRRKMT